MPIDRRIKYYFSACFVFFASPTMIKIAGPSSAINRPPYRIALFIFMAIVFSGWIISEARRDEIWSALLGQYVELDSDNGCLDIIFATNCWPYTRLLGHRDSGFTNVMTYTNFPSLHFPGFSGIYPDGEYQSATGLGRRYSRTHWFPPGSAVAHFSAILTIPYWFLFVACGVASAVLGIPKKASMTKSNECPRCGYDLRMTPDRCPECGTVTKKEPVA